MLKRFVDKIIHHKFVIKHLNTVGVQTVLKRFVDKIIL